MADEFVDFYEILELPLEAERSEVRKRISELYIEAQKNLDHRNFNTRVRHQQLFEITLPQARYILLDAGRRDDYDRLVRASRAPAGSALEAAPGPKVEAAQTTELGQESGGGFRLSPTGIPGEAPSIDALPDTAPDPETVAREREELWNKWKSGLQGAMEREAAKEKDKPAETAATPLADRIEAAQTGAPQPKLATENATITPASPPPAPNATAINATATNATAPNATAPNATAPNAAGGRPKARPERPKVKFDFGGGGEEEDNTPRRGESAPVPGAEEFVEAAKGRLTPEQIQERRDNHRRTIMKEELENTGVKGLIMGAGAVLLPGIIFMTIFMSTYYPPNKESPLAIKSAGVAWILWLLILGGLAYLGAYMTSKSLRRKQAMQLSMLSYEELLRHTNKDF